MTDARHVLFFNSDSAGHLFPTLALVEALVSKGIKVTYIVTGEPGDSTESNERILLATGCECVYYSRFNNFQPKRTACFASMMLNRVLQGGQHMLDYVSNLSPPPTGVVYDPFNLFGYFVAKKLNLPFVCTISFSPTKDMHNQMLGHEEAQAIIKQIQEKYDFDFNANHLKIDSLAFLYQDAALNILFTVEELLGFLLTPEENGKIFYAGASIAPLRHEASSFPLDRFIEAKKKGKKIFFISLGTLVQGFIAKINSKVSLYIPKFWKIICEAVAERPNVVAIMSVVGHTSASVEAVTTIPPNLHIFPIVPQVAVLKISDVFLTHGGAGSTNEGLSLGVPLLVLPFFGDQFDNGYAVERANLGFTFPLAVEASRDSPVTFNPERECFTKEKLLEKIDLLFNDVELPERLKKIASIYQDRARITKENFVDVFLN